MKRDLDLIRRILLAVEDADDYTVSCQALATEDHDVRTIAQHVRLLQEAGLLEANLVVGREGGGAQSGMIDRLTWQGHEFIDAARNNTVWEKAKTMVAQKVGGLPFELIYAWLMSYAKVQLGLPVGEQ